MLSSKYATIVNAWNWMDKMNYEEEEEENEKKKMWSRA